MDEDTTFFLANLRRAKVMVKWGGGDLPRFVAVSCGSCCFLIQLWWEVPSCLGTEIIVRRFDKERNPRGEEGNVGECRRECEDLSVVLYASV